MKKKLIAIVLVVIRCLFGNVMMAQSIDPVSLIMANVIKAIDLKVQQLQNETIRLQQAQQVAEHALSKAKLEEISAWGKKQEALYAGYFQELRDVKPVVRELPQVGQIVDLQGILTLEYTRLHKDPTLMERYDALLRESKNVMLTLQQVLGGDVLSMKDAERLLVLCKLRDRMSECVQQMRSLNKESGQLAQRRSQTEADMNALKKLNGRQ